MRDLVMSMAGERVTSLRFLISVQGSASAAANAASADAVAAPEVLGFNRKDAENDVAKAMEDARAAESPAGDLVREALRFV